MKLIKLNAIDSTNSFLKDLAQNSRLENYTVVVTNEQTKGRGQQTNHWVSEPFKNLTTSIFINNLTLNISDQKYLNYVVSLAILDLLSELSIDKLSIKWPNDIMSANKKICGILIENSIRNHNIYSSIIGIGLNVNQVKFPEYLKNVTSLKLLKNKVFDLEALLVKLVKKIKLRAALLSEKKYEQLEDEYLSVLYKKNVPTMFKDSYNVLFMGKITGISSTGNLLVELEDDSIKEFGIKEISLA